MILVTGGTGLTGSHLLYELLQRDLHVRAIKRPKSNLKEVLKIFAYYDSQPEKLFEKIEWIEADILDYNALVKAIQNVDTVYHCAAIVSFNPLENNYLIKNNVEGTNNIVNACLTSPGICLCHVSSITALGNSLNDEQITEETRWDQNLRHSAYSKSKYYSELAVWRGIEEGMKAVIVNPSVIMGPGRWDNNITAVFKTIYKGFKYYPPGSAGFVDVRDVATAMIELVDNKCFGERFIVSNQNFGFKELLSDIAEKFNQPPPKKEFNYKLAIFFSFLEKIRAKILGTKPIITRDSIDASYHQLNYSNEKLRKAIDIEFIPIKKSIEEIAEKFLKEHE